MDSQTFHNRCDGSVDRFPFARFTPRSVLKTWLEFMDTAAQGITPLIPGRSNTLAWLEFRNKLRAFYLFQYCDSIVSLSTCGPYDRKSTFNRLGRLESWDSVWAAEGVGRQCASSVHGDLSTFMGEAAAGTYLVPFHTGMGMTFAETALHAADRAEGSIDHSLYQFFELCDRNSQDGFAEAAYETLGLVARTLFPNLITSIDGSLAQKDPGKLAYFWHGVGRAQYFLPTGFIPGGWLGWDAIQRANQEPPHTLGRLNATAGVAWAFTLVNNHHPEILQAFFERRGEEFPLGDAVVNGVQSALIIWHHCTGDWTALSEESIRMNGNKDSRFRNQYLSAPCRFARRFAATVVEKRQLGKLFRYRPLTEWTSELDGGSPPTFTSRSQQNRKGFGG